MKKDKWSVSEDGAAIRFHLWVDRGGGDGTTHLTLEEAEVLLRDLTRVVEIKRLRQDEVQAHALIRAEYEARIEALRGPR